MGISSTINQILTSSNPNLKIVKQTSGILDLQVSKIRYSLPLSIALLEGREENKNQYTDIKDSINDFLRIQKK